MYDEKMLGDHIGNKPNASRLIEWLLNGAKHTRFDIEAAIYSEPDLLDHPACGSVCCAGGAASQMLRDTFGKGGIDEDGEWLSWHEIELEAFDFLGVDKQESEAYMSDVWPIFSPRMWYKANLYQKSDTVTGRMVAMALIEYSNSGDAAEAITLVAKAS